MNTEPPLALIGGRGYFGLQRKRGKVAETGYTGSRKYEPVGIVHRGEFYGPCECGGWVNAYWDGEVISHSAPLDLKVKHVSFNTPIMFGKEWYAGAGRN